MNILYTNIQHRDIMTSNPSIIPPPAGQVSNFINPHSIAIRVTIANATCMSLSVVAVTLRMYTRYWLVDAINVDDCKTLQTFELSLVSTNVWLYLDLLLAALVRRSCLYPCTLLRYFRHALSLRVLWLRSVREQQRPK